MEKILLFIFICWQIVLAQKNQGIIFSADQLFFVKSYNVVDSVLFIGVRGDTINHAVIMNNGLSQTMIYEQHRWVESSSQIDYNTMCAALHGPAGCPDKWYRGYRICSICLRKERIHEVREVEQTKSTYELLNERVKQLKDEKEKSK